MTPRTAVFLRHQVMFWILAPLAVTTALMLVIAVAGYAAGPNADGVLARFAFMAGFLVLVVPVIAAHVITIAALVGVGGIAAGVHPDRKLLAAIAAGLVVGSAVLYRLYFAAAGA